MTGLTGMTGATGVTGPTAPNVTANNYYAFGVPGDVAGGGFIPVPAVLEQNGTAITPGVNGTITLAANQTYAVDYRTNARSLTTTPFSSVSAALYLGATLVTGSNSVATSEGKVQVLAGSAIITTDQVRNLSLRNPVGTDANYGSTSISVIKLA
ncbi:hypothetical protein ACE5LO_27325 [Paenibacillus medicaginis]|uniref:BclA C-terminal domain-containing protein n=1 Tax=Paenibacillus medicaginis TaxID=1470560 RepID=A0ABV5C975_9BACL